MWCPKCKNEYREGIRVCSDCNIALVVELPKEDTMTEFLVDLESEQIAEKLSAYLKYSDIECKLVPNEESKQCAVFVDPKEYKKAKKAFAAFYSVELSSLYTKAAEEVVNEAETDGEEGDVQDDDAGDSDEERRRIIRTALAATKEASYVSKEDKSNEYKSAGYTFVIFGVIGIIVMLLYWIGVYSYFSTMSAVILTVMFVVFLVIGIDSFKSSKKASSESVDEKKFVENLTSWLDENVTKEDLITSEINPSKELQFFAEINVLKEIITNQFGELNSAFLDDFAENYYNDHFDA